VLGWSSRRWGGARHVRPVLVRSRLQTVAGSGAAVRPRPPPRKENPLELALILLALVVGALLPVQAGVNAAMARHAGRPEWAAFLSFAVGLAGLAAYLLAARLRPPSLAALAAAPAWSWVGGLLGAVYVTAIVMLTPRIGFALTLALTLAGQMVAALALDHAGALGLATRPITVPRLAGAVLLFAGVLLMRR
jgi:transporter family-2 protein